MQNKHNKSTNALGLRIKDGVPKVWGSGLAPQNPLKNINI